MQLLNRDSNFSISVSFRPNLFQSPCLTPKLKGSRSISSPNSTIDQSEIDETNLSNEIKQQESRRESQSLTEEEMFAPINISDIEFVIPPFRISNLQRPK